jgi:selenophosphate synthetase-related protein
MDLREFCEGLREFGPLVRKRGLYRFEREFSSVSDFGMTELGIGDDAGALRHGEGYLLLAADGMMPGYVRDAPYHAGKSSILVNVNDIYAMGGRPMAVVDVLAGGDKDFLSEVVRGLREGAERFRVPIVGGHYHPEGEPSLSVGILGEAGCLLRGDGAKPGEVLVTAYALSGRPGPRAARSFDAFSDKPSEELICRREVLCEISERCLASSCRDISNGGIIGALLALSDNSNVCLEVDVEAVPRAGGIELWDWLVTFPSYGFVLSLPEDNTEEVIRMFSEVGAQASVIGKVAAGQAVRLNYGNDNQVISREILWGGG